MTRTPIQLIVGLCNPGPEYEQTRHNAGAWFVEEAARRFNVSLRPEVKFKGLSGRFTEAGNTCHLLLPTTFMNLSGQAIGAIVNFYKIPVNAILVAHDELDLPVGSIKLKQGGGHGGHNGLRDTINHLNSKDFFRLRIGINHPGDRSQVIDYVLKRPSKEDAEKIHHAIEDAAKVLDSILSGDTQKAMKDLHSR
jgi:PTH1 family peptidyl-tRNA hydrolase